MAVQIRCASLESDRTDLIALFMRLLTPECNERRFDWLYRQNPWGNARAWLACESKKGTIVGAAAAFPRSFYFERAKKLGWVLGDFCVTDEYRSMGPALQLQRACLQAIAPPYDFCYDFPSRTMMAVYKRLGVNQTGSFVRWVKPLRIEDQLKSYVGSGSVAKGLAGAANAILAVRGWKGDKGSCLVELHEGCCGEEFTAFDRELRQDMGGRTERTADYLNWRYLMHPSKSHVILTGRRNGALVGYVVVRNERGHARIVDLVAYEEPGVIARLIEAAVYTMKLRGAKKVNLAAAEWHPWNRLFARAGFLRRETSPIVFIESKQATDRADLPRSLYLMEGERDS